MDNEYLGFITFMDELAELWPRINHKSRIKSYYKAFRGIPILEWPKLVERFIECSEKMPLPNNFREAAASYWREHPILKEDKHNLCTDCYNTGFVFCSQSDDGPRHLCLCNCDKADGNERHYGALLAQMPKWDNARMNAIYGLYKLPFPYQIFTPKDKSIQGIGQLDKSDITAWWRSKIHESANYWRK